MTSTTAPMKVIVVGAGLGGLACAIACRKEGLDVIVVERTLEMLPVGAGIQVPPNAARAMDGLGVLEKLRAKATDIESRVLRRWQDGRVLGERRYGAEAYEKFDYPSMVVHRADYQKVLLGEAGQCGTHFRNGCEVKSIDFDKTEIILSTGEILKGDVIIGADGLWSTLRDEILQRPSPPTETGDLAYRGTFSLAQLQALDDPGVQEFCKQQTVTIWIGPDKHAVFYPLRGGQEYNLVLLKPDDLPSEARTAGGDIMEMREAFAGWDNMYVVDGPISCHIIHVIRNLGGGCRLSGTRAELYMPRITKIISCFSSVLKWKLCHHSELETWTRNNVALLGDACHPTLPYQAQGAAMAVEDGLVLGTLLGLHSRAAKTTTHRILQLYEALQKPRATQNVQGAARNRIMYHLADGPEQVKRDRELAAMDWMSRSEWTWIDGEYQRGVMGSDRVAAAREAFEGLVLSSKRSAFEEGASVG